MSSSSDLRLGVGDLDGVRLCPSEYVERRDERSEDFHFPSFLDGSTSVAAAAAASSASSSCSSSCSAGDKKESKKLFHFSSQ